MAWYHIESSELAHLWPRLADRLGVRPSNGGVRAAKPWVAQFPGRGRSWTIHLPIRDGSIAQMPKSKASVASASQRCGTPSHPDSSNWSVDGTL